MSQKLVLVTPGRSGSTHLRDTLNSIDGWVIKNEVFNRTNSEKGSFHWYLQQRFDRKMLGAIANRESISVYKANFILSRLVKGYIGFLESQHVEQEMVGITISLDQWYAYPQIQNHLNNWTIIYLTRKDVLRLSLSLMKARMSGNYELPDNQLVSLDPKTVFEHIMLFKEWENDFLTNVKPSVIITYEELFKNYAGTLKKIFQYLNINHDTRYRISTLNMVNPEDLSDWVENLEEIRSFLAKRPEVSLKK